MKRIIRIMLPVLLLAVLLFGFGCGFRNDQVKHVILFIGDGMQLEHEIAGSRYLYGADRMLNFHFWEPLGGHETYCSTWDVSSYNTYAGIMGAPAFDALAAPPFDPLPFDPIIGYDPAQGGVAPYPLVTSITDEYFFISGSSKDKATDSASAATAMATGYKTDAGNIAWKTGDPLDGSITTVAEELRRQMGFSIGVVSTVPFTHATPAAFVSHNVYRNNYHQLADEIIRVTRPEVVIGGGHPAWAGETYMTFTQRNDLAASDEYVFVERQAGRNGSRALLRSAHIAEVKNKKLFGLFGGSGGNFESPVPADDPGRPEVSIGDDENPWLKDCVLASLNLLAKDPDGFFIMFEQGDIDWANHALDYGRMIGCVADLDTAVRAAVDFVNKPGDDIDWDNTLMIVTSDHSNSYMRLTPGKRLGKGDLPTQEPYEVDPVYGPQFDNSSYPGGEVSYAMGEHTNELVMLYAFGSHSHCFAEHEGAWYPGTRIVDNTDIYQVIKAATGLAGLP